MSASEASVQTDWKRNRHEIIGVLVLSMTAVITAWCGFEASKWGGEMSVAFSQASSARIQAGNYEAQARDARQFDLTIYAQWVEADITGDEQLADYIQSRFTPEFDVAFDAWVAAGMPENAPFARPEYVPDGTVEATTWNDKADARFADALANNQRGDNYSLLTVLFALVLFLTAMSQRKSASRAGYVILGLAIAAGLAGVVIMFTFPIKI